MSAEDWVRDRRALIDAATEGPWSAADEHGDIPGAYPAWCVSQMRPGFEAMSPTDGYIGDVADTPMPEDAALIADSRTSLPKALDALEAVLQFADDIEDKSDLIPPVLRQFSLSNRIRAMIAAALEE